MTDDVGCFDNPNQLKILVIGLDNAGKTTIINKLKPFMCQYPTVKPTQAFSTAWIPYKQYTLRFYDMGGASNYRPIWSEHAVDLSGIIFVIDSSDNIRFKNAAEELQQILMLPAISSKPIPLLVFANKNDIEGSATIEQIEEELHLKDDHGRPHLVVSVCKEAPDLLHHGLNWLVKRMSN